MHNNTEIRYYQLVHLHFVRYIVACLPVIHLWANVFKLSCHSLIVRSFRMKKDYYLFIYSFAVFNHFLRSFFYWFFNRSKLSTLKAWLVYEISIWHAKSSQLENLVMFDTRIRFYSCFKNLFRLSFYLSFSS